jgi:hypothetical protein
MSESLMPRQLLNALMKRRAPKMERPGESTTHTVGMIQVALPEGHSDLYLSRVLIERIEDQAQQGSKPKLPN